MNKKYIENAVRTKSETFDNNVLHQDIVHAILGIQTESAELLEALQKPKLDYVNIAEECGDSLWYIACYCNYTKLELPQVQYYKRYNFITKLLYRRKDIENSMIELNVLSGRLVDVIKRVFYYGKGENTPQIKNLDSLITETWIELNYLLNILGETSVDRICDNNIAKLRKRFPNKFETENAFNRNLEAERKILEK